jgi:hypothetical protein
VKLAATAIFWEDRPFQLPNGAEPIGYAWLVERYGLVVMPHYRWSFTAKVQGRTSFIEQNLLWESFPGRNAPAGLTENLEFALKYDGLNLEILYTLFACLPAFELQQVIDWIQSTPFGNYTRKIWFLYEFLIETPLPIENLKSGNSLPLLEPDQYFTAPPRSSPRHRIFNNLPGTKNFCPLVRKTPLIQHFQALNLQENASHLIAGYSTDTLNRASYYLYTKETRSSFALERETPDPDRLKRFVQILQQAPRWPMLSKKLLVELQNQIILDRRFQDTDYRITQNYVGETIGPAGQQRIHYISPKPGLDLSLLMEGWFQLLAGMEHWPLDPVVSAAVLSFAFVFLHPFEDGNGRIHRFLIHYILSRKGFTPPNTVLPVSAVMLKRQAEYDACLERFSRPLLERIRYTLESDGELEVDSETATFYRYFDATPMAESLYRWLEETIQTELPMELDFLVAFRDARAEVLLIVELPDRLADLMVVVCFNNKGRLSKTKRTSYFSKLTDQEVMAIEQAIQAIMARFPKQRWEG